MPHIESGMRERIAAFLPRALEIAIASYQKFSAQEMPEEAAEFKKHHDACKMAVAHIELLLKLAKMADLPQSDENNDAELRMMIEAAQGEVNKYKGGV